MDMCISEYFVHSVAVSKVVVSEFAWAKIAWYSTVMLSSCFRGLAVGGQSSEHPPPRMVVRFSD